MAEQKEKNAEDATKIFDRLGNTPMRQSLEAEILRRASQAPPQVLKEIYLALGRRCELVFAGGATGRQEKVTSAEKAKHEHLDQFLPLFDGLPAENRRTGIEETLHRISRTVHAITKGTVAITARIGRTIQGGVLPMIVDSSAVSPEEALAQALSKGLLLIGPPNAGKTTVLRELARLLSRGNSRVVVIVDKSLEIAGTGTVPHEAIGDARVLTVERPQDQHKYLIEAVENQSPDFVIVDELSTKEECQAARTITGRGVAVIASVHGESLAQIVNDPERSLLCGGVASVTLSAREAEARPDKLRQVSRRYGSSVFGAALELRGYEDWIFHHDLETAVDKFLDFTPFAASWRKREAEAVVATPLLACRQPGSSVGFAYARLRRGESLAVSEGPVDFTALDPASSQRLWTETSAGSRIFERTSRSSSGGFSFAQARANGFQFGAR